MSKKKEKERQPLSSKELEDFLKKAKQGSREAQDRLIKNYENLIYKEASRLAANSFYKLDDSQKKDLAQEGRYAVLRAIEAYDKTKNKSFFYFARTCIKNAMLSWLDGEQRAPTSRFNVSLENDDDNNQDPFFDDIDFDIKPILEEENEEIKNILKSLLSKRENDVFLLNIDRYTYKEIANALNLTEKQVDNALRKAKGKLKNNDKIKEIRERLLKNKAIVKNE